MDFYIPNLEKVKHLLFLPEMKPIEEYSKIVDDILNKQFNEFIERKEIINIYYLCIFYEYEFNRIKRFLWKLY